MVDRTEKDKINEEQTQQTFQDGFKAGMCEGELKANQKIIEEIEKIVNNTNNKLVILELRHLKNIIIKGEKEQ